MRKHTAIWVMVIVGGAVGLLLGLLPVSAQQAPPDALPKVAFVARNDVPFDALTVGPVAGALGAVTVITPPTALSQPAEDALVAFDPDAVYLVGGTSALSSAVEADVGAAGSWTVDRISGPTRDATARELAQLPATLGYDRPILLSGGGSLPQMWGDAYARDFHDHGINPGAAGAAARTGGVKTGTATGVDGASWITVAELTVPGANLVSNCPFGSPAHNFLVEASATVEATSGAPVAGLALTIDSTTFPSSVTAADATTLRQTSVDAASASFASVASHFQATLPEGPDRTFRLVARGQAGSGAFDVDPATLVVQHLGYQCVP